MTTRRYKRVPQQESNDTEESKKQNLDRLEMISTKVQALFWVAMAIAVSIYTDFAHVALRDHRIDRLSSLSYTSM
jgi:hypothetical protein